MIPAESLTAMNYSQQPSIEARIRYQIEGMKKEFGMTEDEARKYLLDSYARLHQALKI
jgi:hypothetical protein